MNERFPSMTPGRPRRASHHQGLVGRTPPQLNALARSPNLWQASPPAPRPATPTRTAPALSPTIPAPQTPFAEATSSTPLTIGSLRPAPGHGRSRLLDLALSRTSFTPRPLATPTTIVTILTPSAAISRNSRTSHTPNPGRQETTSRLGASYLGHPGTGRGRISAADTPSISSSTLFSQTPTRRPHGPSRTPALRARPLPPATASYLEEEDTRSGLFSARARRFRPLPEQEEGQDTRSGLFSVRARRFRPMPEKEEEENDDDDD